MHWTYDYESPAIIFSFCMQWYVLNFLESGENIMLIAKPTSFNRQIDTRIVNAKKWSFTFIDSLELQAEMPEKKNESFICLGVCSH